MKQNSQSTSTGEVYSLAQRYLNDLLKNAPEYGSAGLTLVFHAGHITRVEVSSSILQKPTITGGLL